MKLRCVIVLLLSLVILSISIPTHAAASENTPIVKLQFHEHEISAIAGFQSSSSDGCFSTSAFVIGARNNTGALAFVFIDQFNSCAGTELRAFGSSSNPTFRISDLNSARLQAIVPLTDQVTGNTFTVSVDMSWTATTSVIRTRENETDHIGNSILTIEGTFFNRDASASGTVSDGTTNFTPSPAYLAQLARLTVASMEIIHS
jgi:hypothetical protein